MFFSESTCAPADEDAATRAAKAGTRLNRTNIESSLLPTHCRKCWLGSRPMRDYVTFVHVMTAIDRAQLVCRAAYGGRRRPRLLCVREAQMSQSNLSP